MKQTFVLIAMFLLLPLIVSSADISLLKNVTIIDHSGSIKKDRYIIIYGAKIKKIGLMSELDKYLIADFEYDLKDHFVYPAFIDPFFQGLHKKVKEEKKKRTPARGLPAIDKTDRKPFKERKYFIKGFS
jgi:imidazolonepropionase-like amidohydrolase